MVARFTQGQIHGQRNLLRPLSNLQCGFLALRLGHLFLQFGCIISDCLGNGA